LAKYNKREEQKMKKLLALVLSLTMILLFVSACTQKTDENVLRVGMECGYAPYNWTQTDDSNGAVQIHESSDYAYGYDVMMAKYLAEKLGYTVEVYKIDWNSLPLALEAGTIDCVIAGQSITADKLEVVDFTDPYYYASIVVLTTSGSKYANAKGLSELSGASCTSQLNTVWYDDCLPQIPNANIQTATEDAPAMLVNLESGKCDLIVTDIPTAKAALAVYSDMVMLDFTGKDDNFQVSDDVINLGISVKKGNTELLDKLNTALDTLTVEDFEKMMSEAISVQPLSK
jgi:putative lysine transport system substrate-binding protein